MSTTSGKAASPLFDPPHLIGDVLRYGTALALVAATFGGIALALGHAPVTADASDADSALMIDLPPAETSQTAAEPQNAITAAAAQPPRVEDKPTPPDMTKPDPATESKDAPPPAPAPAAPLEEAAEPLRPVTAPPPAPAQAPTEAGLRADVDESAGDEGTPHASARRITQWQKTLMRRLEAAKRSHHRAMNVTGTVKIAFAVDGQGIVRTAHVAASSGAAALDAAALSLVRDASPFPAPPSGAGDKDRSFVVPIRFRH